MLNKPKFMTPSTNVQECTIDVAADKIMFSCIVDGNEAIGAWCIKVYKLSDNTKVLDTEKQSLSTPFFPIDEKNRNVVFSVDLKTFLSGNNTFVNSDDPYYWTIEFWNITAAIVENAPATTISCEEVFYANATPSVVVGYSSDGGTYSTLTSETTLSSRRYYFKANCGNIQLKRYGWRLIDTDNDRTLLDTITHNQVYGTVSNIICSYNGFLDGCNYSIEVYIETQTNQKVIIEPIPFSVSYETIYITSDFKIEALKNEPSVMLNWGDTVVIEGKMLDKTFQNIIPPESIIYRKHYPIVADTQENPSTSVVIPKDNKIVFNYGVNSNMDVPEDSYIVLSTQLPKDEYTVNLFYASGNENGYEIRRSLTYYNGQFDYVVITENDAKAALYNVQNRPSEYVWYIFILPPLLEEDTELTFTVIESVAEGGLYPSDSLYPSSTLYPSFGTWDKIKTISETS